VFKESGSPVYAGTVNGDGVVHIRTTKPARDTALFRIMRMVQEAQSRRAAVARWVDRFAAVYTPIMMLFSLLTAVVPPLLGLGSFSEWTMRGLVVLVTSCPCALAISTPVTIVAGLTSAVRRGVLIKGGVYLEGAARIQAVAFDKTGTLTSAELAVDEAIPARGRSREELLGLAAALEANTTHPAGKAIHAFALAAGVPAVRVESLSNLPGLGMQGEIDGRVHYAGSPKLYERVTGRGFSGELLERSLRKGDLPQALVFTETGLVGAFLLEDAVRDESRRAVEMLKELGIGHVAMLTGDAKAAADKVGAQAGVDAVHAGLMPEDKVAKVRELKERFGRVAMVGDGVNDAPALATADLGIAMGAIGTGAAIETADIALMSDDLAKLPWLIGHARRTLSIVRQNIVFALGTKAVFILLALSGLATLWMAVVADMGTSLLVIANGLRLLGSGRDR
jgi:Cd2+/Zn2+-exporting ATPase